MAYKDFTELPVWKKSFELLMLIYESTKKFPSEEKFGLTSDMRRAANSIVHNIAEGFGRYEPRDKTRFYKIPRGSSYELFSQALLYLDQQVFEDIVEKCRAIIDELNSLIKSIENHPVQL